ncbi:MAG: hypothetical protein Pyrs2KO_22070 [Pyruvatibacter sp.]
MQGLTPQEAEALFYAWDVWARDDQLPPDPDDTWTTWLLLVVYRILFLYRLMLLTNH